MGRIVLATLVLFGLVAGPPVGLGAAGANSTHVTDVGGIGSGLVAGPGQVADSAGSGGESPPTGPNAPAIAVAVERHPGAASPLSYTVTVSNLDGAADLWVLTDDAAGSAADGLTPSTETPGRYRWDGESTTTRLTLTPAGDATSDGSLTVAGEGWAFAPVPTIVIAWRSSDGGEIRSLRPFETPGHDAVDVTPAEPGVVGERFAMLGALTVHTRETARGEIRLVVPATVDPRADPAGTLDALESAAERFDGGSGREDALVFVLPPSVRAGGATFVGSAETWINADARLRTADNVWLHEYVHTRQTFDLAPGMAWFEEASAEYFGARLARETGLVSPLQYETYLGTRTGSRTNLTDRDTWGDSAVAYHRGVRVLAALDAEIGDRSGGQASLLDVYRRLNRHEGPVTYADFVEAVSAAAGEDMRPWLDRHVAGNAAIGGPTLLDVAGMARQSGPLVPAAVGLSVFGGMVLRRRWTLP